MKLFLLIWFFSSTWARLSEKESMAPDDQEFWDRWLRTGSYNSLYPTTAPTPPLPVFNCSSTQTSGGASAVPQEFMVDLKQTRGVFDAFYEMYQNPDALDILYEGANIFSTGGLVSGSRNFTASYGSDSSKSTSVTLKITAPNFGTGWIVAIGCPN